MAPRVAALQAELIAADYQPGPFAAVQYGEDYANSVADHDWLWSYDVQEWAIDNQQGYQLSEAEVFANLQAYLEGLDRTKDQIILVHDHELTSTYFPSIIATFTSARIRFVLPPMSSFT